MYARHSKNVLTKETVTRWLELIKTNEKRGQSPNLSKKEKKILRERLILDKKFVLDYEDGSRVEVPAGTEVVFYCLFKSYGSSYYQHRASDSVIRTEAVFYPPNSQITISVIGSYGRKKTDQMTEREYDRKSTVYKDGSTLVDRPRRFNRKRRVAVSINDTCNE